MTEIKYCGLTTPRDIHHATEHDADHIGLVVHAPRSHRNLDPAQARTLARTAPGTTNTVLVTVTQSYETLHDALDTVNPDTLQLPYDTKPPHELAEDHGVGLWLAMGIKDTLKASVRVIEDALSVADRVVLDALKDGYGGHGEALDWDAVRRIVDKVPRERIVLAGGLTSDNVREAASTVRPGCVDVSSGIETDGVNDPDRMRAFARAVREEVSA